MRAGPKAAPDASPVPFRSKLTGSARFALWAKRYLRVPQGTGARKPLILRPWQVDLVGSVWDADPQPRLAAWCLPRGQGKSALVAGMGLYDLMTGEEGASVVVVATDERQAGIVFGRAVRMVELNPALESRVQVFRDRLAVPARGATFQVLPAEPKRLEGLDPTLALIDEVGVVSRETFEVVALASGKRERSTVLGIGTPGPDPDNLLAQFRAMAGSDPSFVYREFSAAGFEDHPPECEHCWALANPALGDFLHRDALVALLPPKTREQTFRRARLCQFVTGSDASWIRPEQWNACADTKRTIPDHAPVVLGVDASYSSDATAIVAVSIETRPRIELVGLWEPSLAQPGYRVPLLDVEDKIREAARRYQVREVAYDPYRLQRTAELLSGEGLPMVEVPQTPQRMAGPTAAIPEAVVNHELSHTGDPNLARHVGNAIVRDDARGVRIGKATKDSPRKIDAAVALVMAYARARFLATQPKPPTHRVAAFR